MGSHNYCEKQTSLVFTETEGSGAVGAATGREEELNLHPCEAKSARRPSTVQPKPRDRHMFPSARKSASHQQPRGGRAPGASEELQQPAVLGCSSQEEMPRPSAGYSQEGEKPDRMPQPQNDVRECVAMVAAEG